MYVLRPCQADAIQRLRAAVSRGFARLLLCSPTGSGKTVVAASLIHGAAAKGKRALFLAHARQLVGQASRKLAESGVDHGVIMAGFPGNPTLAVQVASKDTLVARAIRTQRIDLPPADLVVVDECHRSLARWWQELLGRYPKAIVIGLTATPCRTDGRGLGDVYETLVELAKPSQLIADGYLVPTRVFAPYRPDLKGCKRNKAGEYREQDIAERLDKPVLVGDVVRHWLDHAKGRPTVVFAAGVQHSLHLRNQFRGSGVRAEHIDANTPDEERDRVLTGLSSGSVSVVTNCGVMLEGVDVPALSCAVLARTFGSYSNYRQAAGRIQRPAAGKADALLLDHSGSVYLHGFPDADVDWRLDVSSRVQDRMKPRADGKGPADPVCCPKCSAVFAGQRSCPNCGWVPTRAARAKDVQDGKLFEVGRDEDLDAARLEEMKRFWHRCLAIAANRGGTCRMASAIFKKKWGDWPDRYPLPNIPRGCDWERKAGDVFPQYVRPAEETVA